MSLSLIESLAKLVRLSPSKLHETSRRLRTELGGAEWKLSLCLLATVRRRSYRNLGFANITEYAEKALQLSGKKAGCLLGTARALEHLPLLSEAFREGRIGWGKLRAIRGLATPETEKQWLEFALSHHTDQVVRKVSLSPASWKRHQALQASLEGTPVATESAVDTLLSELGPVATPATPAEPALSSAKANQPSESLNSAHSTTLAESAGLGGSAGPGEPVEASTMRTEAAAPVMTVDPVALLPSPPKTIRLVFELSPDEYALYERAESRIRAQARRRISRAKVLTKMSETVLNSGTARSRAKHQVLIHSEIETGTVWYDTEKGPLPVDASVLNQALEEREPLELGRKPAPQTSSEVAVSDNSVNDPTFEPQGTRAASESGESGVTQATSPTQAPTTFSPEMSATSGPLTAPKPNRTRRAIPNATLRSLFAQAGHQCQRCGARDALLDIHHTRPVSEGGDHRLKTLRLLCQSCHSLTHEPDFATKPRWRAAKLAKQRSAGLTVDGNFGLTGSRRLDAP